MAARSSAGVGVGITITLLGVACLGLFISTIIFYSKYQKLDRDLASKTQEWDQWVKGNEQGSDIIARLRDTARKEKKSVVGYLNDSLRDAMTKATGSAGTNSAELAEQLKKIEGGETSNLIAIVRAREASIESLNTQLAESDKNRQTALANMQAEADRKSTRLN